MRAQPLHETISTHSPDQRDIRSLVLTPPPFPTNVVVSFLPHNLVQRKVGATQQGNHAVYLRVLRGDKRTVAGLPLHGIEKYVSKHTSGQRVLEKVSVSRFSTTTCLCKACREIIFF